MGDRYVGNIGPFRNVQPVYWLGSEQGPGVAWDFNFGGFAGFQGWEPEQDGEYVWAVRVGDVPEPSTGALLLMGIPLANGVRTYLSRRGARKAR